MIGMGARENAADSMRTKQFESRIDSIAAASDPDIHDCQGQRLGLRKLQCLFARRSNAGNFETGVTQRSFHLVCDEQIVFDDKDTVPLVRLLSRYRSVVGRKRQASRQMRRAARESLDGNDDDLILQLISHLFESYRAAAGRLHADFKMAPQLARQQLNELQSG